MLVIASNANHRVTRGELANEVDRPRTVGAPIDEVSDKGEAVRARIVVRCLKEFFELLETSMDVPDV